MANLIVYSGSCLSCGANAMHIEDNGENIYKALEDV